VKFSIRVPPAEHRHIKVTAARAGMSIQDLAVTAIREYLDRLGHPLPTERAT
jgi:predicted HicB family RNase H-like nuclease